MTTTPSIPKGTRDFLPEDMAKRNYIFSTISRVYRLHGFAQIETPAMENLSVLMGKYGDEGDKLLFKILNSGDYLSKAGDEELSGRDSAGLLPKISEKGLRYDLTVPFARLVVQHRDRIKLPFKRYQIQPVWRADRPQKGRYREFYQCDADIVGSESLLCEADLLHMLDEAFTAFGIRVEIKINNRKVLQGLAESIGCADKIIDMTVAIDKLDKIGLDNVNAELAEKGFGAEAIEKLQPVILLEGGSEDKLSVLREVLSGSEAGLKGIEEIETLLKLISAAPLKNKLSLDLTLARGLNYYTGTIIEAKALDVSMGSIAGGGRYDDLTGVFGLGGLSGVGISFGADRIYDVLNALDLYPADNRGGSEVIFINFGSDEAAGCLPLLGSLRAEGIACELYPDAAKLKKQLSYADEMGIPFAALVGADELREGMVTLKNLRTKTQEKIKASELAAAVRSAK